MRTQAVISSGMSCKCGLKTSKPTLQSWLDEYAWKKEDLNTKFSKGSGFNRAEDRGETGCGCFGSNFSLKTWL